MNPLKIIGWLLSGKTGLGSMVTLALLFGGGYVGATKTEPGAHLFDKVLAMGLEKFGNSKKDLLIERVSGAKEAQEEAAEVFESALDEFKSVTGFQGGELESQYNKLKSAYDKSKGSADKVSARINKVTWAANRLILEWEGELAEYSDPSLRAKSEAMLERTSAQCKQLVSALEAAEQRIHPVLSALNDHTKYLKHNLNSQAIASLQGEVVKVEGDVDQLIREMKASIAEAAEFIKTFEAEGA